MSTDKKVDFLVCGTQKGGTTALRAYLQKHNSIDMPKNELHFFDNDSLFGEKRIDYAQYHKSFSNNDGMSVWGETTPIYMYWKECPKRIFDYNPQMKLIFLLRDPVKRAYSHWNMEYARGKETIGFKDAVAMESTRLSHEKGGQHRVFSYIDRGFYGKQLKRLLNFFPFNQMLLLSSSKLQKDPATVLKSITSFLNLKPLPPNDTVRTSVHRGHYGSDGTCLDFSALYEIYKDDSVLLTNTFGFNCLQ